MDHWRQVALHFRTASAGQDLAEATLHYTERVQIHLTNETGCCCAPADQWSVCAQYVGGRSVSSNPWQGPVGIARVPG